MFWKWFRKVKKISKNLKKISKKIFWNTDQVFRSVFHFFKRPKLWQKEVKSNSKKYGEGLWFFLYNPVVERGTLTVRSFEIRRGQTWPKPKINFVKFWCQNRKFEWDFEFLIKILRFLENFGKFLSKKTFWNTDRYFRSVFLFL